MNKAVNDVPPLGIDMAADSIPSELSPDTLRTGLIGATIQASRSPVMHMREAKALGLSLHYQLFDLDLIEGGPDALPRILDDMQKQGFLGCNITHPCKQTVMAYVDELSDDAKALGAVNTVVFRNGKRTGHNTDWSGFAQNFERELPDVKRGRVVQLGCGGAGSAVAYALLKLGVASLSIFDPTPGKAEGLAENLGAQFGADRIQAVSDITGPVRAADGIVNCTPIGMAKYPGLPLPKELLRPDLWVSEIVYFPLETELLREARALGCRTMDGGGMAVIQAGEAQALFTGVTPDYERMLREFRADFAPK